MCINHFLTEWFTFDIYMFLTNKNIIVLEEVDSTNNYAKQLIGDKEEEGTVVLAHFQNEGKGQMGNYWESEARKNLLFSLILYPEFLEAGEQFYLSKIVSLALVEWLKAEVENVSIKWPNDIYVGNKKIAGILIENAIKGRFLDYSIVGVGLNLNQEQFCSDAPNPIALKQLSGKHYDADKVLRDLLNGFSFLLERLKQGDYKRIDEAYMRSLFRNKGWHLFRKEGKAFKAQIIGIGEFGQLQLELETGKLSEFMFKEVEFVI